jgi:hypothetical protein
VIKSFKKRKKEGEEAFQLFYSLMTKFVVQDKEYYRLAW